MEWDSVGSHICYTSCIFFSSNHSLFPKSSFPDFISDHVYDIVTCVFQYLEMLRRQEPLEWIFKEYQVQIWYFFISQWSGWNIGKLFKLQSSNTTHNLLHRRFFLLVRHAIFPNAWRTLKKVCVGGYTACISQFSTEFSALRDTEWRKLNDWACLTNLQALFYCW